MQPDANERRMTGTTPSVSLKYAGQIDDYADMSERAAGLLNLISSQRLYAKEFVAAKELGLLDSGSAHAWALGADASLNFKRLSCGLFVPKQSAGSDGLTAP